MATRNLPSLLAIVAFGLRSPLALVFAELGSALLVGWFVYRSRILRSSSAKTMRPRLHGEGATLWLARLGQYVNASLLRLIIPFVFAPHETGLFFFACIAQIPCSLFLSVTTQLFGHALARMKQGECAAIGRIQLWFLAPNALYVAGIAVLVPYWPALVAHVPKLTQYAGVGSLILAVSLYSGVLSSDCTEYLLRSRGLSRFLLRYNVCSVLVQITCLGVGALERLSIERSITLCALAAGVVLTGFSAISFQRVLRAPVAATPSPG